MQYSMLAKDYAEEEVMIRDSVREFVSKEVIPIIEKHNREATFPIDLVPKMAELGLLGTTFPQKYDCAELNYVSYGLVTQELERGDSGILLEKGAGIWMQIC